MSKELAERVYRKHKNSIFGVVLTKHFFQRFFERSNDMNDLKLILTHLDRKLPEIIFDLMLADKEKVVELSKFRMPMFLDLDSFEFPLVVVKTVIK